MYYQLLKKLDQKFNFSTVTAQYDRAFGSEQVSSSEQISNDKVLDVPITPHINSYVLSAK